MYIHVCMYTLECIQIFIVLLFCFTHVACQLQNGDMLCDDGTTCVAADLRCNGVHYCADGSDEMCEGVCVCVCVHVCVHV